MNHKRSTRNRSWLIYIGAIVAFLVALEFVFDFFPEEDKELRRGFRKAVENTFPQQAAEIREAFGLTRYAESSGGSLEVNSDNLSVVLVHGLDDPGKVWMNLAPRLLDTGFDVWEMRYPNDQPIVDSAHLFYDELRHLALSGIERIAVVAHSMGGLVAREMLTNPKIAYVEKARSGEVPGVVGLIMVGTPNHGSELARFRTFAEIRDQWTQMLTGQGHLLRGILDGAGEAKIDLLPQSKFLNTLNKRAHPQGIKLLIVAGIVSPWDEQEFDRFFQTIGKDIPTREQKMLEDLKDSLESMRDGLGDGLVTVESTRLDGIEHRTVSGTHLSMIRNVTQQSERIPPAVPLITEALQQIASQSKLPNAP